MKNVITMLLLAFSSFTCARAQVGIGVRDSRFLNVSYTFAGKYNVELEHSFFNEKFSNQHIRLSFAYRTGFRHFTFELKPYAGTTYNAYYYDMGAMLTANYLIGRVQIEGIANPHYDRDYKYTTCWCVETSCRVYKELCVVAQLTTIPENRQSEMRLRAGFRFGFGRIWVKPLFSTIVERQKDWKNKGHRLSISLGITL